MSVTTEELVKAAKAAIKEIDVAEARRLQAAGVRFIDVREAAECAKAARGTDRPAGFFINFPVQRPDRRFAGVDAAAWQLKFRIWFLLIGQKHIPT